MARMKQTPVKSSTNSRADVKRVKRKASKRGTTDLGSVKNNKKRQRSKANTNTKPSSSKRKHTSKGDSTAYLPPELRQAGLLAHQSIAKGKCFGPFRGQFVKTNKKPVEDHAYVSKITGIDKLVYYFYVHNNDQEKCMWLQRLQSAPSKKQQNMVAYKSVVGVCYEATCDISPGEELLVLYDDSYGGKKYPAYVENIPIHFVSPSGQLQVVPLDDTETPVLTQHHGEGKDEQSTAALTSDKEQHDEDDSNSQDDVDEDEVDMIDDSDDDDYVADEDMDNDDEKDDTENDDTDDDDDDKDDDDEEDYKTKVKKKKKKAKVDKKPQVSRKIVLKIYELKTVNLDNNSVTIQYQCSYCAVVHANKEAAEEHMALNTCKDQVFKCEECAADLENNVMKPLHKCHVIHKCVVCDVVFPSNKQLSNHIKNTANDAGHRPSCVDCACCFRTMKAKIAHLHDKHPTDIYNCPICSRKYTSLSYLKEHVQSHVVDAFKCPQCQKQFSSKSNLRKHIRKHNPDYKPYLEKRRTSEFRKKHPCGLCEKKFDSPRNLQVHMRSHTGERPYECNLCSWKFSQNSHLRRHMNTVHATDEERQLAKAEQPKTCHICNKVYANTRVLRVHIQAIHNKERPHKCNHCQATFSQRGHLWRHKHTVHSDSEEIQKKIKEAGFVCNVDSCTKAFPCQSELISHQKTVHQSDWKFMCDKCDGRFANKSNLTKHMTRKHANELELQSPHICELCSKEFNSLYKLEQHKRTHTGEKEFKCDLCGQMFAQKSGLRKHIRCRRCPKIEGSPIRERPKNYECSECSRVFPGPADLKAHRRTHTGERPFECEHCHKKFSQAGNLSKHIKYIHQKVQRPKEKPREKKFFCSLCGKAFSCPSSLAMHCRIHSGTKPFACEKCDVAFAQLGNLKKHMQRWHEGDGSVAPKRRRKKKQKQAVDTTTTASEELEQSEVTMETSIDNEAEKTPNEESELGTIPSSEGDEVSNQTADDRARAEQTAIASILTSINTEAALANPRGFTPLNTPTHGFFISPLVTAPSSVGPSVIMNTIGSSVASQIPQTANSVEYTRGNQVFVPPQLSAFVPPVVTAPHSSSATDGTTSSSSILPHVNTILSPQLNTAHYISHSNQVPEMSYPFSPSSLFQH